MLNKKALAATAGGAEPLYVEDVFSTYLYTGNGSTQTITNNIDLSGEGGLVWVKSRSIAATSHVLFDTARGVSKYLQTNSTAAQVSDTATISQFNNNGFYINGADQYLNQSSSDTYASWTFRKAEKFFDVVTYTGNGNSSNTINHNLGSVPGCIIVKETSGSASWYVYHRSIGNAQYLTLNTTDIAKTGGFFADFTPTSTQFKVGFSDNVNQEGATYVAYLFAHDAGGFGDSGSDSVIKCGSFTANSGAAQSIDLGWEPQFVIIKASSGTGNWFIRDTMRGWDVGGNSQLLSANLSDAETSGTSTLAPNATGFQHSLAGTSTFIYIAIRRGPMKTPEAGTEVFEPFVDRTSIANKTNGTMGPVDLGFQTQVSTPFSSGTHFSTFDRLRGGGKLLATSSTAAEGSGSVYLDTNQGVRNETWFSNGGVGYNFKRAPGFFDVVCYTGTGSARTISHNLGVAPEMLVVRSRDITGSWVTQVSSLGPTKYVRFDDNGGSGTIDIWNDTAPTSTVFSVKTDPWVNGSGSTYVAYLFATVAGVSKVGSYTGTASTLSVNCGFTSGARFVLVKRTDTTGDWYVWDSARGIVSGNDPYLLFNSTATEVTNTDYIDSISSGFELTADGSSTVNIIGGTYIFLAIA